MSYSEDKFREHVQSIIRANTPDGDRPLTLNELKELALSMGLTEREWDALLEKAEVHLDTAFGHLKAQNFADAIVEAEQATAINPYIKDGNSLLAMAYLRLAQENQSSENYDKARHHAQLELKNDPMDGQALNVLSAVDLVRQDKVEGKNNLKRIGIAVAGLVVILLIVVTCNSFTSRQLSESINNSELTSDDTRMAAYWSDVKAQEGALDAAVDRRNNLLLEMSFKATSEEVKQAITEGVEEFDVKDFTKSDRKIAMVIGEMRASSNMTEGDWIQLEGANNRVQTERKRLLELANVFNEIYRTTDSKEKNKYEILDYR